MNIEEVNLLPLPPGWAAAEVHQYAYDPTLWRVVLVGPTDVRVQFGEAPGVHVLHGVRSIKEVDRMLRHYLPARDVRYPHTDGEQLSWEEVASS